MSTPLSFCDITARYGQAPALQIGSAERTSCDFTQLYLDYIRKVQDKRREELEDEEEDALMAVIDAMNASEEDKRSGRLERELAKSLARAGTAVVSRSEKESGDGTKEASLVDPIQTLTVQVLLSCVGDRATFEQADEIQENTVKALEQTEQKIEEEQLEVTGPNRPSGPENMERR